MPLREIKRISLLFRQNSGHVNIPVQMRALIIATEDHYDEISSEIGNTYNPAVELNNTVTVIDSDD